MALSTPTEGPRIVPFAQPRLAADKLPNGRPGFRVTQRFADPDAYLGGKHGALDLGNYNCGDKVLASVSGTVANLRDSYGALIVEIREKSGAVVGYGHLSKFALTHGAATTRGKVVGYVGDTGLGHVCHIHFYRRSAAGMAQDPWPQLEQNAAKKVKFNAATGINIRSSAGTYGTSPPQMGALWGSLKAGKIIKVGGTVVQSGVTTSTLFTAKVAVRGAKHGLGGAYDYWWTPMYIGGAYRYVATPLITYA